eukprot:COSAG01_NODE_26743_length_704_cov_1.702479_2_plen_34_part_01
MTAQLPRAPPGAAPPPPPPQCWRRAHRTLAVDEA